MRQLFLVSHLSAFNGQHLFGHTLIQVSHLFVPSSLHPFISSSLHPFIPSSLHSFLPSFLPSFIHSFTFAGIHSISFIPIQVHSGQLINSRQVHFILCPCKVPFHFHFQSISIPSYPFHHIHSIISVLCPFHSIPFHFISFHFIKTSERIHGKLPHIPISKINDGVETD